MTINHALRRRWQINVFDSLALAFDYSALENILKFTNVARPVIGEHLIKYSRPHLLDPLLFGYRMFVEDVIDQNRKILKPLAQRRKLQWNYIDSVVEILTQAAASQA